MSTPSLWLLVLLTFAAPVSAELCKYVDRNGDMHYTNIEPEKGWKKVSCGVGAPAGLDPSVRIAHALAKVRVGMTIGQMEGIDRVLVQVPERTELVTAAGKTVVRRYPDGQQIVMRDGRVTAILREGR
ncbi:MAG TPA: hypothetical protein VGR65_03875 [Casimicrobiaceae bacterium]|jgi:hypothetical protein|nr:hypothetical protein [Casimicrobiaceae bacterium]